jgi:hypothetical protein
MIIQSHNPNKVNNKRVSVRAAKSSVRSGGLAPVSLKLHYLSAVCLRSCCFKSGKGRPAPTDGWVGPGVDQELSEKNTGCLCTPDDYSTKNTQNILNSFNHLP